jgi:hypothetical protein
MITIDRYMLECTSVKDRRNCGPAQHKDACYDTARACQVHQPCIRKGLGSILIDYSNRVIDYRCPVHRLQPVLCNVLLFARRNNMNSSTMCVIPNTKLLNSRHSTRSGSEKCVSIFYFDLWA